MATTDKAIMDVVGETETRAVGGVSVKRCPKPDCPCGSLILKLHDEHGRTVAGIVLPKPIAKLFAAQVAAITNPDSASDLSTIECQGVA